MQTTTEEILDLVDENDQVIGQKPRKDIYTEGLHNFRVVNVFIRNSEGKLWIPRRSATKKLWPLGLDMSMGGHVESGETYEQAFRRESEEELNINTETLSYSLLGHLDPHTDGVAAFMNVYEIKSDTAPDYNKSDFSEYYWLTPQEVLQKLDEDNPSKDDLPKLIKKFYV